MANINKGEERNICFWAAPRHSKEKGILPLEILFHARKNYNPKLGGEKKEVKLRAVKGESDSTGGEISHLPYLLLNGKGAQP